MSKRVLLCLSHSIEEYDQVRLLHGLGYQVASIGGYIDPAHPHDTKRPALDVPCYSDVKLAVDNLGEKDNLGVAQSHIPDDILAWLGKDGTIIYHHYLERLFGQWDHLRDWREGGGRIIWRTVGQSTEANELRAQPFRDDGLEIVRYSPRERNIPEYAGEDVMIRFFKDPAEWHGWTGEHKWVINFTQHLYQRDPWTNYGFWKEATRGLQARALGPGSEAIGGTGELSLEDMQGELRQNRCYLYTGTQPASYTLGLIEAMMTGIPTISIGPDSMQVFPYGHELFEGHLLTGAFTATPEAAKLVLSKLLEDDDLAREFSKEQREHTIAGFGIEGVGAAWKEFLG